MKSNERHPKTNSRTSKGPTRHSVRTAMFAAATVLLAILSSGTTTAVGEGYRLSCVDYEDDWGGGGSDVSCDLDCPKGSALLAAGSGNDKDASIAVAFNCGGESAGCSSPGPVCAGASTGLTTSTQIGATCSAETDEAWSSMVFVACASVGGLGEDGGAMDRICSVVGEKFPPCKRFDGASIPEIEELCRKQNAVVITGVEFAGLFPAAFAGHQILSMRSLAYSPDGAVASLLFDGTAQEAVCTIEFNGAVSPV